MQEFYIRIEKMQLNAIKTTNFIEWNRVEYFSEDLLPYKYQMKSFGPNILFL